MAEKQIAENIRAKIYTIRGLQVMLDKDLAELYGVDIKRLNEQVKRNIERFPAEFMFQLTYVEFNSLRSQFATIEKARGIHRKYLPYAFTEQGVAMLSGVLKSEAAVQVSIQIMSAFVAMRRFIAANAQIFYRLDCVDKRLLDHDTKLDKIFDAIQNKEIMPSKGIFYDGQIFDAYKFVSDIVRSASESIVLIDNYIDDTVLMLLSKRKRGVFVIIYTKDISPKQALDIAKHNAQYEPIEIKEFKRCHDRFIIIDNEKIYHFGASLKDLGKKWFAFSRFDKEAVDELVERLAR